MRYNVKDPEPSEAFDMNVTVSSSYDLKDKCNTNTIEVCASYLLEDLTSNMAVVEVTVVSGYIPNKDDLKTLIGYGTGIIKRYEIDGNKVLFYIDQLTKRPVCLAFRIFENVVVENAKPGTVKLYDYYDPDLVSTEVIK